MLFGLQRISRSTELFIVALLLGGIAVAQSTAPAAASRPPADNRILAQLDKLTHAKRVNSGDVVTAHLVAPAKLPDPIELAKGSKLVGTIADVKAKAHKEGPSKMGLLFTTVAPKDGKEITVSMVLVTGAPHLEQNDVDLLAAGNPFSGQNGIEAETASNTLNSTSNEGEALSRGLGARAPASHGNLATGQLQPRKFLSSRCGNSVVRDVRLPHNLSIAAVFRR